MSVINKIMGLKDLPIWLKTAFIFTIISFVLFLVSFVVYLNMASEPHNMAPFAFFFYGLTTYPTILLLMLLPLEGTVTEIITLLMAGIINWFLIGAIIGWIVGKIKYPRAVK